MNGRHLVLTGYDDNMRAVGSWSSTCLCSYAIRHGYSFEVVRTFLSGSHPSWQKLRIIEERLARHDAILWVDADVVVTNPAIDWTKIPETKDGLWLSRDWDAVDRPDYFSAGVMIVFSCSESLDILKSAQEMTQWANTPLWDQCALQGVFNSDEKLRSHIHVLPRRMLNSVPAMIQKGAAEPWEKGDFLCHLTGIGNDQRMEAIGRFVWESLAYPVAERPC
jgi:hypothetical protein